MNKLLLLVSMLVVTSFSFADSPYCPGKQSCTCEDDSDFNFEQGFTDFADVVFVRPISLAVTGGIGFPAYAVSAPFTAMTGDNAEAWNTLVEKPAEFTFDREIGEFDK